jgi:hypothetical protein
MVRRLLILLVIGGVMITHPALAQDDFSKNNPDVKKYEFARSYISALNYMKDINDRWNKNAPKKLFANQKDKMIKATLNDLAWDSSDLRVIKNYLLKYLTSPNMLMRKVADIVVVATSREIAINDQEKILWEKWYNLNAAGETTRPKEIDLVNAEHALELRRKEADKDIIQASVFMTKVLISEKNKNGKGHLLAITAQQRQKLLDKLDSFGGDTLDWGLKPGQSSLEGSIAVIREILEDSIWISIDEK